MRDTENEPEVTIELTVTDDTGEPGILTHIESIDVEGEPTDLLKRHLQYEHGITEETLKEIDD